MGSVMFDMPAIPCKILQACFNLSGLSQCLASELQF